MWKMRPILLFKYIIGDKRVMRLWIISVEEQRSAMSRLRIVYVEDISCDHLC